MQTQTPTQGAHPAWRGCSPLCVPVSVSSPSSDPRPKTVASAATAARRARRARPPRSTPPRSWPDFAEPVLIATRSLTRGCGQLSYYRQRPIMACHRGLSPAGTSIVQLTSHPSAQPSSLSRSCGQLHHLIFKLTSQRSIAPVPLPASQRRAAVSTPRRDLAHHFCLTLSFFPTSRHGCRTGVS